jgi:hypothetical protein
MFKSGLAIIRSFLMFKPHVPLGWMAAITGVLGLVPFIRFLVYWFQGESQGHIQSLIFGSAMLVASLLSLALLIIADLLKTNRILIEESLERVKQLQYGDSQESAHSVGSICDSIEGTTELTESAVLHDLPPLSGNTDE